MKSEDVPVWLNLVLATAFEIIECYFIFIKC